MKWMLTVMVLAAAICGTGATASAKSKFYNAVDSRVEVAWTAGGCAGVKSSCGSAITNVTVCKQTYLAPGQSSTYSFKSGTFFREVAAAQCNNDDNSDISDTSNGGKKARCAAILRSNNTFATKCGYTAEEYEALKNQPLQRPKYPIGVPR